MVLDSTKTLVGFYTLVGSMQDVRCYSLEVVVTVLSILRRWARDQDLLVKIIKKVDHTVLQGGGPYSTGLQDGGPYSRPSQIVKLITVGSDGDL